MATRAVRGNASSKVTVYIRGANAGSKVVKRSDITRSAMNNARTSFEIEGHHYRDSDWLKIMRIADELAAVI